ncbi:MAG: hypothetical protein GEU78_20165, partial [Actinobacteria bacterium]|nr:hypothetical protein [Actinomycetota bacterium]
MVANTLTGFVTELRAARSMESLRQLVTTRAEVERDDRRDEIDARGLVPGDIVGLDAGERVPADVRLLEAEDLTAEESALTGESALVEKSPDRVPRDAPTAERGDMLFMGTTVQTGRGRGIVVGTGQRTEVGRVAELAQRAQRGKAPLQEGLERLGRVLSIVVVGLTAVLAFLGWARGLPLQGASGFSVGAPPRSGASVT